MKRAKFSDLPPGSEFKHAGRMFHKLGMNLASNEFQKSTVFPSALVVEPISENRVRGGTLERESELVRGAVFPG
jgi:hypothetical protein